MEKALSASFINTKLRNIYESYIFQLKEITRSNGEFFSYPLLMQTFPDYDQVKYKVLYVGKETYGWLGTMNEQENLNVNYITESYKEFEFGKEYHGRNSPFWRFIRACHTKLNGENYPSGYLWTNFSKCDSNKTTPTEELQVANHIGFDLLIDEINIIKPDAVIFLTGWDYEKQFQRVFQGLQYNTIEENYLHQCVHPRLPVHSYMTMHPKGLQLRNKFHVMLESIVNQITR